MIYFVHGPDRLLARQAVASIAAEIDPSGGNTSYFYGPESSVDRVLSAVGSASFFGSPRLVVVSEMLGRATPDTPVERSDDSSNPNRGQGNTVLARIIAAVPDENVLVIHEPATASAPAALRSAASQIKVIAGEPPRGNALLAWIADNAARQGAEIDRLTARLLAETLFPQTWDRKPSNPRYDRPPDLARISSEIEKLALFAYPDAIRSDHIAALTRSGPDQRLFRFVDAALAGNLREGLVESARLQSAGEDPAMLLAQVLNQAELAAPAASAASRDAATVARDLGAVAPGRMSAVMSSIRSRRERSTMAGVERGVNIDRRLKTGDIRRPDDALHELLIDLARCAQQ